MVNESLQLDETHQYYVNRIGARFCPHCYAQFGQAVKLKPIHVVERDDHHVVVGERMDYLCPECRYRIKGLMTERR